MKIRVTGGTYRESCEDPHWLRLFGSGLRAAAAISGHHDSIDFHTYVGSRDREWLAAMALTFSLNLDTHSRPEDIDFRYEHPLSRPDIRPPLHLLQAAEPIEVEADCVLRFGFLEGDAIVKADRVVYDPQSAFSPRRFSENGSTANHLAVVANLREACSLTGEGSIRDAGTKLLASENAEVVVIKYNTRGAFLFTNEGATFVSSYPTSRVWPLGSGDVFSAVFAQMWGVNCATPLAAVETASRLTALYCTTKTLPLPVKAESQWWPDQKLPSPISTSDPHKSPLIYLAGPFFTMKQRWLIRQAHTALIHQGARVFSPLHDVGLGSATDVVAKDIKGLDECDGVLALVDDLDSGTLFEVGYARAKDIPVVAFWQGEGEEAMKMLSGTDCMVYDDFTTCVYNVLWATMK